MKLFISCLLGFCILLTIGSMFTAPTATLIVMVIPLVIMFVVSIPVFSNTNLTYFSPWSFLIYFSFLNVFLRSYCIANTIPDATIIDSYFLLGKKIDFLLRPSIIVLFAFILMTIGFLNKPIQLSSSHRISNLSVTDWNPKRFNLLVLFGFLLALIAFIKFISISIQSFLLLSLNNFSSYRGTSSDIEEYSSNGYLRWIIQFSDIIMYLLFVRLIQVKRKSFFHITMFVLTLLLSISFYIFVQSRSGVMMLFVNLFILSTLFNKKRISVKKIIIIAIVCLSFFGLLTSLRQGSGYAVEKVDIFYPLHALEPVIVNNGGIDISKTGHIIDFVDRENDFKFGGTLIWLLIAWIPRQIWPTKPVNIDTIVGMKIYSADTFGTGAVPPGVFAELYWNFWYIGLFLGCWIIGIIIKSVQIYFETRKNNCNHMLIYVVCFMQIGIAIVGSSTTSAITGILFYFVPLFLVLRYLTTTAKTDSSIVKKNISTIITM